MKAFHSLIYLSFLAFVAFSCNRSSTSGIPILNIDEALKSKGTLKLSQIADDVELIQLHGMDNQTYIRPAAFRYITGRKVILLVQPNPSEILLFDRSGSYTRRIGHHGKGPHEYLGWLIVALNEKEEAILVADNDSHKFLIFNYNGECLLEKGFNRFEDMNVSHISEILVSEEATYILDHEYYPGSGKKNYDLIILDSNLNSVKAISPRNSEAGSSFRSVSSSRVFRHNQKLLYWSKGMDTLFGITKEYDIFPKIVINNPLRKIWDPLGNHIISGEVQLRHILEVSDLSLLIGDCMNNPFVLVWNRRDQQGFQVSNSDFCGVQSFDIPVLDNDLFGYNALFLPNFCNLQDGHVVHLLHPGLIEGIEEWSNGRLIKCLQAADVLLPEKRDELVRIIKNLDENSGPVLMVVRLK